MSKGKILFQLTGSIACFKACVLISKLVQAGFELEVVASHGALEFVGLATLEGLTGRPVHTDTFEPGRYMSHIHLAKWADLTLIYPATANTLNKLAAGIGDDLISTLFLAHDLYDKSHAIWLAPAMNVKMYQHPATQRSLSALREWGVELLATGSGHLACGDQGEGRLLEPELVLEKITAYFAGQTISTEQEVSLTFRPQRILVTAGGTREPIDGVRVLTNSSSGQTGAEIADRLASCGHRVTLLRARDAHPGFHKSLEQRTFSSFADLQTQLKVELSANEFESVIHLAAVSDYSVAKVESAGQSFAGGTVAKIDSAGELTIRLMPNPKLVDQIRAWSRNARLNLIAFKLTNTSDLTKRREAVHKLALHSGANWVVHNDLSEIGPRHHAFTLYSSSAGEEVEVARVSDAGALGELLEQQLTGRIS